MILDTVMPNPFLKIYLILLYVYVLLVRMYIYALYMCLVPLEADIGHSYP